MTPERLQQIRHVFEYIVELPPPQRDVVLRETGEHDLTLIAEVEKLIYAYEHSDGFIERPIANLHLFVSFDEHESDLTGVQMGPYHLLHLLGAGGMGEVWRAEQMSPVRRQVAIKLIKAGMDTREVMARFASERQTLALMDHPAIAKVFDAGSTPEGRPYFVMEYVCGIPITTYCDEQKLTTRERLRLFIRVCEGVQHAHQKAVIHRDLKPSNILVTEVDGRPMPKIIDFGVAKAISQQFTAETVFTRVGMILGTPDYMSPEQACSAGEDIDTRTDVYSLGVILYELLVGALPFDFRKLALDEILRELRTTDVPRPSTKFRALNQQVAASSRRTEPTALIKQLRGDLDAIAMKALEKDRSRRYGAPSELAADVERHLRSEAVTARPASVSYKLQKLIRRHRASAAMASLVLILLAAFGIAQAIQVRRITRERDRADHVASFTTGLFRALNPGENLGNKVTAREILDKASNDIGTGLASDPELKAQLLDVVGGVYYNLGLYPQAESLQRQTLEIRRRTFGSDDSRTLQSMTSLGHTLFAEGHLTGAEKLYQEVLANRKRVSGPNQPDTLRAMNNVAIALTALGRESEGIKLHRTLFEARLQLLGPEHQDTLISMANLGITLNEAGQYIAAERLHRKLVAVQTKLLGPQHPKTLDAMEYLAWTLYYEGRTREAEKLNRNALEDQRRILGREHVSTLMSMVSLGLDLDDEGRYAEAEKLICEAFDKEQRILGPEHPDSLYTMSYFADLLSHEGRYAEAEKLQRKAAEIRAKVLGPSHPRTLYTVGRLAGILILTKHFDEAELLSHQIFELQLQTMGAEHPDAADTLYNLASIAGYRSQPEQAFSYLRSAIDHGLRPNAIWRMERDPKLLPLHGNPSFSALVAYARQHVATKLH